MGQKINPIGLRLGINRTGIRVGTRIPVSTASCCMKMSRSANSSPRN